MLLSSHCITYYTEQTSFLCLGELSYSFLCLDQAFRIFRPFCFQCCGLPEGVPSVWSLCRHSLWGGFILFVAITFLIYVDNLALTEFSWLHICVESWMAVMSTFPWSAVSSITPFMFNSDFISCVTTFHFFAAPSSFLANFLSIIHCHKMLHGFISTRRQHSYTLCCLCVSWIADGQRPIIDFERRMWLITDHQTHLSFT